MYISCDVFTRFLRYFYILLDLVSHFGVKYCCTLLQVIQYFGEPEGRVKIQMTSKSVQQYYTLKCLIRDLLSNAFFSQNSDLSSFIIFREVGGNKTSANIV